MEKPEICRKACSGKYKLDTKAELKQNNPILPKNPRRRTFYIGQ
jgi:hypothetical protein